MNKKNEKQANENFNAAFPNRPLHWIRFDKGCWNLREKKFCIKYSKILSEIVDLSYKILMRQIAGGAILVDNEASFQLQFAYILKTIGELHKFSPDDLYTIELENTIELKEATNKSETTKARVDIILSLGDTNNFSTCAIELKYFKKKNQREPNNRYDVFLDLSNLEQYKKDVYDLAYFIIGTDHEHYVDKCYYSINTKDFDFSNNKEYKKGTILTYNTAKTNVKPIVLDHDYIFMWDKIEKTYSNIGECDFSYFLKLEIK